MFWSMTLFFTIMCALAMFVGGRSFMAMLLEQVIDQTAKKAIDEVVATWAPALATMVMMSATAVGLTLSRIVHSALKSRNTNIVAANTS